MSSIEKDRQLWGTGPEPQNVAQGPVGPRAGRPRFRLVIVSSLKGDPAVYLIYTQKHSFGKGSRRSHLHAALGEAKPLLDHGGQLSDATALLPQNILGPEEHKTTRKQSTDGPRADLLLAFSRRWSQPHLHRLNKHQLLNDYMLTSQTKMEESCTKPESLLTGCQ